MSIKISDLIIQKVFAAGFKLVFAGTEIQNESDLISVKIKT